MDTNNNVRFEIASSLAVVLSILIMALETFDLPKDMKEFFFGIEIILTVFFVAEYVARIAMAESKREYLGSFYGLVDLIALLPILIHATASVRVVRLLRLLRVLRLLKLTRYSEAMDRYREALTSIVSEVILFMGVSFVFILGFAFLIYEVEHEAQPDVYRNIFDAIWWAVISLTSVGYGDVYPLTVYGRLLTLAMVLTGMGIVAVPTALLASALSRVHKVQGDSSSRLDGGAAEESR